MLILSLVIFPATWAVYRFFVNEPPNMTGFQRLKKRMKVGLVAVILVIAMWFFVGNSS